MPPDVLPHNFPLYVPRCSFKRATPPMLLNLTNEDVKGFWSTATEEPLLIHKRLSLKGLKGSSSQFRTPRLTL